jgi:cytochrome c peroxidase
MLFQTFDPDEVRETNNKGLSGMRTQMTSIWRFALLAGVSALVSWLLLRVPASSSFAGEKPISVRPRVGEAIEPLPQTVALDDRKVLLGQRLFHDARLSADGTVSCASCHNLDMGGVDRLPRSVGIQGQEGSINAPTVFNSGFNYRQFWDGRASSLEDQIDGPLQNPREMGSTWAHALATVVSDPQYRTDFAAVYPNGIDMASVKNALATFERSLITPNSRFDRYLRGDESALTVEELRGYKLFRQVGCVSCHQGMNLGGNLYQKFGIMDDYFSVRGHVTEADLGRYNTTRRDEDRFVFRVPSLRNVAVTAPYFHDASAATLEEAVRVMARYQLGKNMAPDEVTGVTAFLRTLTGEYMGRPLQ